MATLFAIKRPYPSRTGNRAAYILDRLKNVLAVKDLRASFDHNRDPSFKREVLEGLYRNRTEEATNVILKAADSDMVTIRKRSHLYCVDQEDLIKEKTTSMIT
jgi:hypothetical protein